MKERDESMKLLFIGLGTVFAAAIAGGIAALRCRRSDRKTDDVDGGVVKRYYHDMPKVIESSEIESFCCVISLFAACETEGMGNRVYRLDARLEDGGTLVKYDWYDRHGGRDKGEYRADAVFMTQLQKIVSEYDFARHNGYSHTVSGLPAMYGESLDILYVGGERICVRDNQSGFLQPEAQRALISLFGAATKLDDE